MSPSPQEMTAWVLDELAVPGNKGMCISNLFDGIDARLSSTSQLPPLHAAAKNTLWTSLIARGDIQILHHTDRLLEALSYEDVLDQGFGETKVTIRTPSQSSAPPGNIPVLTGTAQTSQASASISILAGSDVNFIHENSQATTKRKAGEAIDSNPDTEESQPSKKQKLGTRSGSKAANGDRGQPRKRGRPRKSIPSSADSQGASGIDLARHVITATPTKKRGRPPKSTAASTELGNAKSVSEDGQPPQKRRRSRKEITSSVEPQNVGVAASTDHDFVISPASHNGAVAVQTPVSLQPASLQAVSQSDIPQPAIPPRPIAQQVGQKPLSPPQPVLHQPAPDNISYPVIPPLIHPQHVAQQSVEMKPLFKQPIQHQEVPQQPVVPQPVQQTVVPPRYGMLAKATTSGISTYKSPYSPSEVSRSMDVVEPPSNLHSMYHGPSQRLASDHVRHLNGQDVPQRVIQPRPDILFPQQVQHPEHIPRAIDDSLTNPHNTNSCTQATTEHGVQLPPPRYVDSNRHIMSSPDMACPAHYSYHQQSGPPTHILHSVDGIHPSYGLQSAGTYLGDLHGSLPVSSSFNHVPDWGGYLQVAGRPVTLQPQSQGPPLGSFSKPADSAPAASTPDMLVLNKRKRGAKNTPGALNQSLPSGSPTGPEHGSRHKPMLLAEIETMEATLSRFSAEAEAVEIPDVAARLFACYNNVVGNLLLSSNKIQLKFQPLSEDSRGSPLLDIQVTQVRKDPFISMKGSRPMELQFRYEDESGEKIESRFYIGQSEAAYIAANIMRKSIAKARSKSRIVSGQHDPHEKRFQCKTCSKKFKNREGLKYHLEKSNTTCNPKFVPRAQTSKPKPISKQRARAKTTTTKHSKKKQKTVDFAEDEEPDSAVLPIVEPYDQENIDQKGPVAPPGVQEDSSDSVHDSDDSIFEWAEKVAFVIPGQTVKSAPPTPKKTARKTQPSTAENTVLQGLVDQTINDTTADEDNDNVVENVMRELIEETASFTAVQEQIAAFPVDKECPVDENDTTRDTLQQVSVHRSKEIILNLINKNFGIFPGEKSIWAPFVAQWLLKHPRAGDLPTWNLCNCALDQLVQEKELVSMAFPVSDNKAVSPTRTIVALPAIELHSTPVHTLKELIRMAYPEHYVPSRFATSTAIREKLEPFLDGSSERSIWKRGDKPKSDTAAQEVSFCDSESENSYENDNSTQSDVAEDFEEGDSDSSAYGETSRESKRSRWQARRMKSYWAASKATGSNALTKTGIRAPTYARFPESDRTSQKPGDDTNRARSRYGRPKAMPRARKSIPIPVQDAEKRRITAANKMPNFTPTSLQNEDTGAWDQVPFLQPEKVVRQKVLKYRLPEVITYLQSQDGTWANRAYGHGSPPLFPRLQRRADGNPYLQNYINKIEAGHRPIVTPSPSNGQILPAIPSRTVLGTAKPKQRRKRERSESVEQVAQLKRKFNRSTASTVSTSEDEDGQPTSEPNREDEIESSNKLRRTIRFNVNPKFAALANRKETRDGQDLDEIQMLDFFEPRASSDIEKIPNPGLVTLPLSFWVDDAPVNGESRQPPAVARDETPGLIGIDRVALWEQEDGRKMLSRRTKAAGFAWINHTVDEMEPSFDTKTIKLKWDASAAFGIENLPYKDLSDCEDIEIAETQAPTKSPKLIAKKKTPLGPKKFCTRRLTAWPTDFDGVLDSVDSVRKLDVQLAPRLNKGHGRSFDGTMTTEKEGRLLTAIIVITTLAGGLNETVDWVLVHNLFPKFSPNYIRKAWGRLMRNQKVFIQTLTSDFQEAFISAYETGEVPPINYDNLVGYDWAFIADWAYDNVYLRDRHARLPSTGKELRKMWDIEEQESGVDRAREMFFDPKAANYKRMDGISATARTNPSYSLPTPMNADDIQIDEVTLARSWIKAVILTPQEDYDARVAKEKILHLGESLVYEVRQALVDEKVIMHANKGRAAPGRSHVPTDALFSSLRKHGSEQRFAEAVEFKKFLDSEFLNGKPCVRSNYVANEGTIMCITNLQAHGRITLKGVDVPMNKMGLTGGGYETRKMPKETFRFEMDIYPTHTYLFNADIVPLQILEFLEPPKGGESGEIPIWYGVTGNLIPAYWRRILVGLFSVTSFRSGASVASLERTLRPALEEWEIWRLMEWGVTVGLVSRIDESHEGWKTEEWWWTVVGRFCVTNDEMK